MKFEWSVCCGRDFHCSLASDICCVCTGLWSHDHRCSPEYILVKMLGKLDIEDLGYVWVHYYGIYKYCFSCVCCNSQPVPYFRRLSRLTYTPNFLALFGRRLGFCRWVAITPAAVVITRAVNKRTIVSGWCFSNPAKALNL